MSSSYQTTQITGLGTAAAPLDYLVKDSQTIGIEAITATFDGTSAAGSFQPCIQIITDSGHVLSSTPAAAASAGDVVEVTFAPFLRAATSSSTSSGITEVGYVETQAVNSFPGTIITGLSFTVGSSSETYLIHYYCPAVRITATQGQFVLVNGATHVGIFGLVEYIPLTEGFNSVSYWRRITGLSAGVQTFSVVGNQSGGGVIECHAGTGVLDDFTPAFLEAFLVS